MLKTGGNLKQVPQISTQMSNRYDFTCLPYKSFLGPLVKIPLLMSRWEKMMSNLISVKPEALPLLLCQCNRGSDCGLRKTPPKLDELDVQKLWLPVRYLNFIEGSTFLEMTNAGVNKQKHDFTSREEAVREYLKEMTKKAKSLKVDTYPEPSNEQI